MLPNSQEIQLVKPTADLQSEFLDMIREYQDTDEVRIYDQDFLQLIQSDFLAYIQYLENSSEGIGLKPDFVPATTFWLLLNHKIIIGESRLRHWLVPTLEHWGGHIGYMIRPLQRGKGYGTKMLSLTLEQARNMGLNRVLLTCNQDNHGSNRVIQKNNGKFVSQGLLESNNKVIYRYWIDF
ncbi:GNAT family N-acetyltransferase [Dolichospermum circinale]|uniref:GNAT family N-acetyltransferase n=1 Tax=Dolichospermum circinale TaxID=109265 RepID=UPI00232B971D|nr:GNAT family N-acetyltransferase [Dolichospermum circinale]MDB9459984.1 GNAT family N-acetyltransferase [Dolichospermum circinale CS-545/17]MDB9468155.1 GNAT family N-acetyltransferase [Dolichospermum circinale CS-539/09]MDB9470209.1 GNAT family N-acetyltransferase [Dolichospermum circinale CS-539]